MQNDKKLLLKHFNIKSNRKITKKKHLKAKIRTSKQPFAFQRSCKSCQFGGSNSPMDD